MKSSLTTMVEFAASKARKISVALYMQQHFNANVFCISILL